MLERARPSGVLPEGAVRSEAGGEEASLADSLFIDLSRLAAYSAGVGICFSGFSITTGRRKIGVLERGCGGWKSRQRQAGVEMVGDEIYFPIL